MAARHVGRRIGTVSSQHRAAERRRRSTPAAPHRVQRGKRETLTPGERRHLIQLVACGSIFVLLVAVKLLLPGRMAQVNAKLTGMLEQNIDVQAVFSAVGRAVSGEADVDGIIADGVVGQQGKAAILTLPDEDSERQMYHLTKRILAEKGYERYEISNYARKGFECRHNLIYWQRKDYLGLGLGAASMVGNRRFSNVSDMTSYMHDWSYCQEEILDRKAQIEETMFLGLRCTAGVSDRMFTEKFGQSMMDIYGDIIRKYISEGFLVFHPSEGRLAFSEAGTDVSNWILSDFLL